MILVPVHDWFHSESTGEIYHYNRGVFEAFPAAGEFKFHTHHSRKVLPDDIQAVTVEHDATGKYWTIASILPMPTPLWREVTSALEIEEKLLERNKMHLEQVAREGGASTRYPVTKLRENRGFNELSKSVLEGKEINDYELTEELSAFFQALKRSDTDKKLVEVVGVISSDDFQKMFRKVQERTSSDSRTLNYTLWKCIARSDKLSGWVSILLSLPFVYGFPNKHWAHMTDFMLEKKPGVRQIHTLRIIGKVAAEFNMCLKLLIGKRARDNFEQTDVCDEQHGFRPYRSAPDAMMIKLLTFESARMQKATMGSLQHDMMAHFDRMYPEMSAIYASKYGVAEPIMQSINSTIERLQRNVETANGVSAKAYRQVEGEPRIGGMVQGKADVPQFSTQQSDIMLKAHKSLTYGVHLRSPNLSRKIEHHSVSFADDTDGQVSEDTVEKMHIPRVVRRLQHSGQKWNNISDICGGAIAHHKCFWQMLAWKCQKGHLVVKEDIGETLVLYDGKGSQNVIKYLPPGAPNVGLGFNLCPNGEQGPHFRATFDKTAALCKAAATAHLMESEAWQLLTQRLRPKLAYALNGTSFTAGQCKAIDRCIRPLFLPRIRLNRHYPEVLTYGPLDYGGMELLHTYTLQMQVQLNYVIKQLRWNKMVANYFLVALDSVQLCSGFVNPIMEMTEGNIDYVGTSYLVDLH
jgi:hypothetical protein